jgi:hypothetical protein
MLFYLAQGLLHFKLLSVAGIISVIYVIWAIGNFIWKLKLEIIWNNISFFFLGIIILMCVCAIGWKQIDILTKH